VPPTCVNIDWLFLPDSLCMLDVMLEPGCTIPHLVTSIFASSLENHWFYFPFIRWLELQPYCHGTFSSARLPTTDMACPDSWSRSSLDPRVQRELPNFPFRRLNLQICFRQNVRQCLLSSGLSGGCKVISAPTKKNTFFWDITP
jgi:hypothetical protein